MTRQHYLTDTYLQQCVSTVTNHGTDEKGSYLILSETVFYPQGGGQPSDHGTIQTASHGVIQVTFVRQVEQEIRHYVTGVQDLSPLIGANVTASIDLPRRLLNARYHTAAHLLGNIAEVIYPQVKAVKGHSFPGEAYVEFNGVAEPNSLELVTSINEAILANLSTTTFEMLPDEFASKYYQLPYPVPANKAFRAMQIGNLMPVPCGGTHLKSTDEIGNLTIRKINNKNDRLKIAYDLI